MNILDFPYVVEVLFVLCALVFSITIYIVLPAVVFDKRTFFKPKLINSLWINRFREQRVKAMGGTEIPQKKIYVW